MSSRCSHHHSHTVESSSLSRAQNSKESNRNNEGSDSGVFNNDDFDLSDADNDVLGLEPDETADEAAPLKRITFCADNLDEVQEADFADTGENFDKSQEDVARIVEQLRDVVLFQGFDEDELKAVAEHIFVRKVLKGEVVIEHGSVGDAVYVVKSGTYNCTLPNAPSNQAPVKVYNGEGLFGELALINRSPRAATITAATDGELWVLLAIRYTWLRKRRAVSNADKFEQLLKSIPLFHNVLDSSLTNRLIDAIEVVNAQPNEVICQRGEPGDAMYFIMDGEVEAVIDDQTVARLGASDFFGERALVMDEGRAATCVTTRRSQLARLPREAFQLLIPDRVLDRLRSHAELAYGARADNRDKDEEDEDEDVAIEYLCHDVDK